MTRAERALLALTTALFAILIISQTIHYLNGECFNVPAQTQETQP